MGIEPRFSLVFIFISLNLLEIIKISLFDLHSRHLPQKIVTPSTHSLNSVTKAISIWCNHLAINTSSECVKNSQKKAKEEGKNHKNPSRWQKLSKRERERQTEVKGTVHFYDIFMYVIKLSKLWSENFIAFFCCCCCFSFSLTYKLYSKERQRERECR